MKKKLLVALGVTLFLSSFLLSACVVRARPARVTVATPTVRVRAPAVVVRVPPPPPRVEVRRPCPPGSYWKAGRWHWTGRRWVWLPGGCKLYPRRYRGCFWVRGRWVRAPGGWRWVPGHWRCRR